MPGSAVLSILVLAMAILAAAASIAAVALLLRIRTEWRAGRQALADGLEGLSRLPAPAAGAVALDPGDLTDAELARLLAECQAEIDLRRASASETGSRPGRGQAARQQARLAAARVAAERRAASGRTPPATVKRT